MAPGGSSLVAENVLRVYFDKRVSAPGGKIDRGNVFFIVCSNQAIGWLFLRSQYRDIFLFSSNLGSPRKMG
jgi:hypothetical protein